MLAVQITPAGIFSPSFAEILAELQNDVYTIYGSDAYIAPDSQDGQLLAIVAQAIFDTNQAQIAVYNSFSPTYAQGTGLSSVVKINGIQRQVSSFSTAVGNVVGQAGTIITNGAVSDENSNLWNLPATVTIPGGGSIAVTVTAQQPGATIAPAGTINAITTPTLGWQTFLSTADAAPGNPVESDATLRQRQTVSTDLPSQTPIDALYGDIANINGVGRVAVFENTSNVTDANGIPAHNISVVVSGGDVNAVAQTIALKKTPGAGTYGTTSVAFVDPATGVSYTIHFFELDLETVTVVVTLKAAAGYSTIIGEKIKQAIATYLNTLAIGRDVQYTRMFDPAYLNNDPDGDTYEITALTINGGVIDVVIAFNEAALCDPAADVTIIAT